MIAKRIMIMVMAAIAFGSCSEDYEDQVSSLDRAAVPTDSVSRVLHKDSLRILDIGNSYTEDGIAFLQHVASACHVDVANICLYCAIRSSGSFKTWYDCYYDRDKADYYITKVLGGVDAGISTGDFKAGDGSAFRNLLQQGKWDVIVLHPISSSATNYDEWFSHRSSGYLIEILSLIMELQPQALIGFYVTHSYWSGYASNKEHSSFVRWQLTVDAVERLVQKGLCDIVIPYGTAIENLRQSSLNNEYDLTRDGTHLELGVTRYAAACCYYETLLAPRCGVSMMGQRIQWDGSAYESPYPIINIDDTTAPIAQKAAALAISDWKHCHNPETTSLPLR